MKTPRMRNMFQKVLVAVSSVTVILIILASYLYLDSQVNQFWQHLKMTFDMPVSSNQSLQCRCLVGSAIRDFRMTSTKQNVFLLLSNTKKLLGPYYEAIKEATAKLKNNKYPKVDTKRRFVDAFSKNYFQVVKKLPSLKTVILESDVDNIRKILPTAHYPYRSSDCETMERKGIYGQYWGRKVYNDTCTGAFSQYVNSNAVNWKYFKLGFPDGYVSNSTSVPLTYIHVMSDASVDQNGDVYVNGTKLIFQHCSQSKSISGFPDDNKLKLHKEVFTIAQFWGTGFFHFIAENLLRTAPYLDFLRENKHILLHVSQTGSFIQKWLAAFGVDKSRLVSGTVHSAILYAPAGGTCGRPAYFASNLLSLQLRQSLGLTQHPRDTVVVLKRSHRRFFRQHANIFKMVREVVKPMGFRVCLFQDDPTPSLEETNDIFQRAVLILGPHGAGLSNMFLSQPGTVVVEGLCNSINLCYRNMVKVLGHRYLGLLFKNDCFNATPEEIKPYLEYLMGNIVSRFSH